MNLLEVTKIFVYTVTAGGEFSNPKIFPRHYFEHELDSFTKRPDHLSTNFCLIMHYTKRLILHKCVNTRGFSDINDASHLL